MISAILFIFGAAVGSFLNVVALRYRPERFLFSNKTIGGRSRCPKCRATLKWFELIPLLSFAAQRRRCRHCKKNISWRYPLAEILSGLIFVFIPLHFDVLAQPPSPVNVASSVFWVAVFLALLLLSFIDLRLSIIPDEIIIFLLALGAIGAIVNLQAGFFLNRLAAAAAAGAFFWFLIFITGGRGMGRGDLKLVMPLGLIFGLPGTIVLIGASFVIGAVFGIFAVALGRKKMKSRIPFGPFLAAAAALTFFFGPQVVSLYANLFYL